jgi:hypothetical protein
LERPGLEVLNFGVPGYGLDQAYLRYLRDGRQFHPLIVIIGIYADDVNRGMSVWHPFMTGEYGIPSTKPRFRLADSLMLERNPLWSPTHYATLLGRSDSVLTELGRRDYFYQVRERTSRWDALGLVRLVKLGLRVARENRDGTLRGAVLRPRDVAPRLAIAVLKQFVARIRADGAQPLFVCFPDPYLLSRFRRDGSRAEAALSDAFPNVPRVDLYPILSPADFGPYGHYTPRGNRKVASSIRAQLVQAKLLGD